MISPAIGLLGSHAQRLADLSDSLMRVRRAGKALYPHETWAHRWRRVRLWLRSLASWRTTAAWLRRCEASPLRELAQRDPTVLERLHRPFLHGHFGARKRLAASLDHHAMTMQKVPRLAMRIASSGRAPIASIEVKDQRWQVTLESLERFRKEGDWTLCIRDDAGRRIVSCTFSFVRLGGKCRRPHMLIGAVQGPDKTLNGRELFRALTKSWYGLRPKVFVVWLAQCLAAAMHARGTLLVSSGAHIYTNWRYWLRKRRVAADYDGLSRDCGALAYWRGWFVLAPPDRCLSGRFAGSTGNATRQNRRALRMNVVAQMQASVGRLSRT